MDAPSAEDVTLAHRLADEAARVAMARFRGPLTSRTKRDGSIVTDADEEVEDALRRILARERPRDAVLGEERGMTGGGERTWILDGIDGTDRFAEGGTEWGCLIALQVDEQILLGVVEQPPIGRRYWATRGGGAYVRNSPGSEAGVPLAVSTTRQSLSTAKAIVPAPEWCRTDRAQRIAAVMANFIPVSPTNHPALQVASGDVDAAVLFECSSWDLAAPVIIVEEAGGRFTDLDGNWSLDSGGGVFSNGPIHEALVRRLV